GGSTATRLAISSAWSFASDLTVLRRLGWSDRTAVLQVDQGPRTPDLGRRPHPPPDRPPEQGEGLGDLLGLKLQVGQLLVAHLPAVEQEPDAPRSALPGAAEVHGGQPPAAQLEAGLLPHLALARLPRRLAVRLHHATGDRPAALVGRLEDQQTPAAVIDERPRRHGDSREGFHFLGHVTRPPLAARSKPSRLLSRAVLLGQLADHGRVGGIDRLDQLVVRDRAADPQRVP